MGRLLKAYENMTKQAEEQDLIQARLDVIEKYASLAEDVLEQEFGSGNYSPDDIIELTVGLIDEAIGEEEMQEKVASCQEAGRILAHKMINQLEDE